MEKFINPLTDFGFKKLFGSEPNKELWGDDKSLKHYRDIKNVVDTSLEQGKMEGRLEGIEEGRKEGRKEEKTQIASLMKAAGESIEKIVAYTGLSEKEIQEL